MKKIVLQQMYEIEIPKELQGMTKEGLLNELNAMYDINGQYIVSRSLDAENGYYGTILHSIDDENVCMEDGVIGNSGQDIFLDGQQR